MNKFRYILFFLTAALLSVTLPAACGGNRPTAAPPAGAAADLPTFRYFYTDN